MQYSNQVLVTTVKFRDITVPHSKKRADIYTNVYLVLRERREVVQRCENLARCEEGIVCAVYSTTGSLLLCGRRKVICHSAINNRRVAEFLLQFSLEEIGSVR